MPATDFDVDAEVVRVRRALHQIPELGFDEHETGAFVIRYLLDECGVAEADITRVAETGIVALIRSETDPGRRCVAIRADMDGLPIQEQGDLEYKSLHDAVMHACGHDAHMAMLLVAARILASSRQSFSGTVKLIFQPAEESPGGAAPMIAAGVLDNPNVDFVFGAHVWNYCRTGEIHVCPGPLMASSDKFKIRLTGRGGHGAKPEGTTDGVLAAANLVVQLHSIAARNVSPLDSVVLSIGTVHAGCNYNVIADASELTGTVRTFNADVRDLVVDRMRRVCAGIGLSFEMDVQFDYQSGYPATINSDERCLEIVQHCCSKVRGRSSVKEALPTMASEDFSYFLQHRPGCFFFIGSAPNDPDDRLVPHHSSSFNIDERCLIDGVRIWVELVRHVLS